MLDINQTRQPNIQARPAALASGDVRIDITEIVSFLKRQRPVIALMTILAVFAGLAYSASVTPRFTAEGLVFVDPGSARALRDQVFTQDAAPSSALIDSQVEIFRSERVLRPVVQDLNLSDNTEFGLPAPGLLSTIVHDALALTANDGGEASAESLPPPLSEDQIIEGVREILEVKRVGFTNVIEVKFTSRTPELAAELVNAVAKRYLNEILEAKYDVARRATEWLQDRLRELASQATAADRAVQQFKAENNIVDTGRGLMNEQQLTEVSSQLVLARAQQAEAQARLERVEEVLRKDADTASVTDSLRNDVITRLRQQFLDAARREAEWSAKYGENHLASINLRNEMRELRRNLRAELERIAQSAKSEYEIAKVRVDSLQQGLDQLVAQSQTTNQAQVTLRNLESAAQTSRALHDNFLQKFLEVTQQQSFPVSEARIITPASVPIEPSYPRFKLILAGSTVLGLILGLGVALLREGMDRVFRTAEQVEKYLGCEMLGVIPELRKIKVPRRSRSADRRNARAAAKEERYLSDDLGALRYVVDNPLSRFTETLRQIKVSAEINTSTSPKQRCTVLAITSTVPREGKSFIAANLAELIANVGQRCTLVDCDLRNPTLTGMLAPRARLGIVDMVNGGAKFDEVVWGDQKTKLNFVPATLKGPLAHTNEIMSSKALQKVIEQLRKGNDYIILDFPPLAPLVDTRAGAHLADAFVYVVEWGRTNRSGVLEALHSAPVVREKMLGCILNKADLVTMERFHQYGENYFYQRYQARYGYRNS